MRKLVCLLPLLVALPAFGQNSITVTASRSANVQPDLVVFTIDVLTGTGVSRDDVLAVLQGSSLTASNFTGVRTVQQFVATNNANSQTLNFLDWTFTLTAPLANFSTAVSQLTALQLAVAQKKNGMSVSFSIQGTQVSAQAQQTQTCSAADLVADARTQAQKLASGAGVGLGSVLAMSGVSVSQPASGALGSSPTYLPACSLTVKFALTGF